MACDCLVRRRSDSKKVDLLAAGRHRLLAFEPYRSGGFFGTPLIVDAVVLSVIHVISASDSRVRSSMTDMSSLALLIFDKQASASTVFACFSRQDGRRSYAPLAGQGHHCGEHAGKSGKAIRLETFTASFPLGSGDAHWIRTRLY